MKALFSPAKNPDPCYHSKLTIFNNLSVLYQEQGKRSKAEKMYTRVPNGHVSAKEPSYLDILRTQANLANLHADQGKQHEAERIFQQVLSGSKKRFGPQHHFTFITLTRFGAFVFVKTS